MTGRDWLWTIGLAVVMFGGNAFLSFTSDWIQSVIPYPKFFVRMMDPDPNYFLEVQMRGNWWLVIAFLGFAIMNVAGEELWWRGYVLPRQELAFGQHTWLLHGVLWILFHVFMPWNLIRYIPGGLALPYVAQKLRNTIPGMIAHLAQNVPTLIQLLVGVMSK